MNEIKIGNAVRDKITGFSGIVIGITEWLTGCDTIGVQPQELKDGTPVGMQWFDSNRIEVLNSSNILEVKNKETGGPQPIPQKPSGAL